MLLDDPLSKYYFTFHIILKQLAIIVKFVEARMILNLFSFRKLLPPSTTPPGWTKKRCNSAIFLIGFIFLKNQTRKSEGNSEPGNFHCLFFWFGQLHNIFCDKPLLICTYQSCSCLIHHFTWRQENFHFCFAYKFRQHWPLIKYFLTQEESCVRLRLIFQDE